MSYINDALKKAQKEKDIRHIPYPTIVKTERGRTKIFGNRWIYGLFIFFVLIFLVFALHSWLDLRTQNTVHDIIYTTALTQPLQNSLTDKEAETNIEDLYNNATLLFRRGNIHEAKETYEDILNLDPGYLNALNNLGVICLRIMDYSAAENYLEKAVRLNPAYVEPYYNLACLHAIKGDSKQGLAYLKKAVSLDNQVKDWAKKDYDLAKLKHLPEFNKILNIGL